MRRGRDQGNGAYFSSYDGGAKAWCRVGADKVPEGAPRGPEEPRYWWVR